VLRVKKIPKKDLFGIFFVIKSFGTTWDSYYGTIDALRPLFELKDFKKNISGFYINRIDGLVRISYFVSEENKQRAISIFKNFFKVNTISEVKIQRPTKTIVAEQYGGEELEERFRDFLALETQIGLELTKADLLHVKRLFATYCWQVRIASSPVKKHFEPTFNKYSQSYFSLTNTEKKRFLRELEERPNWAHMMVNFILGLDFKTYLFRKPKSISEINTILKQCNLDFQIPLDWKPMP